MDFYLKFADKEQALPVLYTVTPAVVDEENNVVAEEQVTPKFANIDVIGTIYQATEAVDEEGNPVMEALDGYHVNVRAVAGEDTASLDEYAVFPQQPRRVWAGDK